MPWGGLGDATTNQEQFRDQPEARAYFSYSFGTQSTRSQAAPLHYGLRLDHDSRMNAVGSDGIRPQLLALLQFDHDNRGESFPPPPMACPSPAST